MEGLYEEATMQQPIATNDVNLFSTFKENQYFDRKSARKDDKEIAKHISAFANAAGGKLVIGIEDDGEVTGFKRSGARDIENFERAALTTCTPTPPSSARIESPWLIPLARKTSSSYWTSRHRPATLSPARAMTRCSCGRTTGA